MRSEFEKNVIHKQIIDRVRFSEKANQYLPIDASSGVDRGCADVVNVGWISYQYQQSKVDELHKISVALNTETIRQREQVAYYLSKNAELQKRVDAAFRVLSQLNALDDEAHKRWKREACMFSQGESNAYEHAVRLLEQALKGEQP